MVRMTVCQQHIVDGFRRDAKRAQIVGHLPKIRPHGLAAAGVDQRPFGSEPEQIAVHRQEQRLRAAHEPLGLVARKVDEGVERGGERAVAERSDFDRADREPGHRCSSNVSFPGSSPARSRIAMSAASWTVKPPEICPDPPRIGSRMMGADKTSLSNTIANGLPTFSCVTWPKRRAPSALNRKLSTGSLVRISKPGWASTSSRPVSTERL